VIWPLTVTTTVIPLADNATAFRESRISKARTSTGSARGISHINPSALDQDCVNIGLALGNDLTNCDSIWVNKNVLSRESESLVLEAIMALDYN